MIHMFFAMSFSVNLLLYVNLSSGPRFVKQTSSIFVQAYTHPVCCHVPCTMLRAGSQKWIQNIIIVFACGGSLILYLHIG